MTYLLFYIFSALLYLSVMLTLRKAIEASGVSRRSFRTLAIVGTILAPLLWAMMLAYGIYGIFYSCVAINERQKSTEKDV